MSKRWQGCGPPLLFIVTPPAPWQHAGMDTIKKRRSFEAGHFRKFLLIVDETAEVEAALYAHPAVAEASVFGLPDDRLGELVAAVVYPKPGAALESEALTQFVARDLASFKVPAHIWFSDEPLPKLGSAKIDKVALRQRYRQLFAETSHIYSAPAV